MNAVHSDSPRALITGLDGFTGRYLAGELNAAGYRVFGTVYGSEVSGPDMFSVDLCDRAGIRRVVEAVQPDVVAHLAAVSFVAHGDTDTIYRTNVIGSRYLLEALAGLSRRPHAVLLASSANIYGNTDVAVIDETTPPNPANDYAVSKLAMEYMARLWMDRLPITIVRPFNYTGVGQSPWFLLPKIVRHFQRGERVIELGNIDVERDFSDVRTVVTAYRRLLEKAPAGKVFNVCSGSSVSLEVVLRIMAEIAGYDIEVRVNPAFVRANEVKRLQGDANRLIAAVGSLDSILLKDTLLWMFTGNSC
ncbi:MAG: GDP-mannose 4,6-dehydratase [Oxalobacter formigenes]|nr:GDP-mannose 4,6-dehydratase [Oxalobacter formigenes]